MHSSSLFYLFFPSSFLFQHLSLTLFLLVSRFLYIFPLFFTISSVLLPLILQIFICSISRGIFSKKVCTMQKYLKMFLLYRKRKKSEPLTNKMEQICQLKKGEKHIYYSYRPKRSTFRNFGKHITFHIYYNISQFFRAGAPNKQGRRPLCPATGTYFCLLFIYYNSLLARKQSNQE